MFSFQEENAEINLLDLWVWDRLQQKYSLVLAKFSPHLTYDFFNGIHASELSDEF